MGIIIRQSILTSVISYVGVVIGYINLLYLFPKFLEPDEIGLLRTIQDAAMLFTPFAIFGLGQSIIKFFPHFSREPKQSNSFITLILMLGIFTYGIFILIFFLFQHHFISFFDKNASHIIQYTPLILWLTFVLLFMTLFEQLSRSLLLIALPGFLREIGMRLLQGILVVFYFLKLVTFDQFLLFSVLIYVVTLLTLILYLVNRGHLKFRFEYKTIQKSKLREIFIFSTLSFVGTSAMILIGKMDSVMVTGMVGLASNAIYTTAFYMATVIEIPKRAITTTASTLIAKAFEKNDIREIKMLYQKTAIVQLIIGALLLIGIWANLENMFSLMPKGDIYKTGAQVVLLVGLGKLIDMGFGPSSEIIGLSRHYWFNLVCITTLAAIVVITNYFFIPRYGITGAAYGSMIALTIYNTVKFIFIYHKLNIQPFTVATFKVIFITAAVVLLNFWLPTSKNVFVDIFYRSATITIVFGSLIVASKSSLEINKIILTTLRKISKMIGIQ
jgi:O-antigen/teichoic acid export membrane protein